MATTKNNPKTEQIFERDNGLQFTKVVIEKIVKGKAYKANFKYTYGKGNFMLETSIGGTSQTDCIEKTEKFLETKLKENEILKL